jgi:hypothetical protein
MLAVFIWCTTAVLDKTCEKASVRTTSETASMVFPVDLCDVAMRNYAQASYKMSFGPVAIEEGHAVGQAVYGLVNSSRDVVL